ncbi:hypothetical protein TARUN_139 [Trichoderma arundinaceum]|uniref:Bacteriophage T5 Orf172 DNA-binding domain-containing protein n=1 Tax=Trichoderma arundinaceum TaxID=490622 RepID=A0A395P177_TRIAR|nr:hypothetical protein TARUN_139 [Trichoderma arundinaceum]
MATTNPTEHPIFREFVSIQALIDEFPNPNDNLDTIKCRALRISAPGRCQNSACKKDERPTVSKLLSEFKDKTELPETDEFYEKMENFITLTHCARRHRKSALGAFSKWKKQRTVIESVLSPASPMLSSSASLIVDDGFTDSLSIASDEASQVSVTGDPIYAEPVSYVDLEDIGKEAQSVIYGNATAVSVQKSDIYLKESHYSQTEETRIPGFGFGSPRRTGSTRDFSPVFSVIYSHPSEAKMEEGIVYILQHISKPDLFKIGYTSKSAEERLKQSNNCYRTDTKIIHETQGGKFRGAQHAERIIQTSLRHQNIIIKQCTQCHGKHIEWFRAPQKVVFETVMGIELFVRMPAYVKEGKIWKLSQDAHEVIKRMCYFSPSTLKEKMRIIQEDDTEVDAHQGTSPETTTVTAPQVADEVTISDKVVENNVIGYNGEEDEGYFTTSPGKPNNKKQEHFGSLLEWGSVKVIEWAIEQWTRPQESKAKVDRI